MIVIFPDFPSLMAKIKTKRWIYTSNQQIMFKNRDGVPSNPNI
ncbi:hypothetical protein [Mesomycoplasma ovipneumoniae]|nr:hypothetical protein [Mesomycoplasma ovipneumoniae]